MQVINEDAVCLKHIALDVCIGELNQTIKNALRQNSSAFVDAYEAEFDEFKRQDIETRLVRIKSFLTYVQDEIVAIMEDL